MISNALVIEEGSTRNTVPVVRSLGRKNICVTHATENGRKTPASLSKYVTKRIPYTLNNSFQDVFVKEIIEYLEKDKYDIIIPVGDKPTEIISKYKDILSEYTSVPVPDFENFIQARDKAQTLKKAINIGIPCPITYFEEVKGVKEIPTAIKFPLIIKPCSSSGSIGISYVATPKDFMTKYTETKQMFGIPLVQEYIPSGGAGYGVSMLFNKGEPIASFTHKRLREYPISGGPSTLRESVNFHEIETHAMKILKSLNWHGVAMVEFKIDPRDNTPKLMEINPRFWGSLPLAIHAGVDFPYLLYKICVDKNIKPVFNYRIGARARWLSGDILWLLSYPKKIEAITEFFKLEKDTCFDMLSFDDPLPAIGEIIFGILFLINKDRILQTFDKGIKR
ncbi:MAG: ATP-grasp domain-containing protein [Candidatus Methanoperedens sp.]|nr:ATP-grasp domain-containing protein [Candidatus Methanoperedens sp.]